MPCPYRVANETPRPAQTHRCFRQANPAQTIKFHIALDNSSARPENRAPAKAM